MALELLQGLCEHALADAVDRAPQLREPQRSVLQGDQNQDVPLAGEMRQDDPRGAIRVEDDAAPQLHGEIFDWFVHTNKNVCTSRL